MTVKLYDADSHLSTFTALVQECHKSGAFFQVVLDRTAFFPEGGGQYADRGTLNGVKVVDVQINDSGVITHTVTEELPAGTQVTGQLDWPLRFRRMQSHSGEHIVSGMASRLFGLSNIGFHLGDDDVTCDYNGVLTKEQIRLLEQTVNEAVFADLPVTAYYPPVEELENLVYRSKLDLTENVRLVNIEGVDLCACCAPHVSHTGEIGLVKIIGFEKSHGGTRLHLRCGWDALADYQEKQEGVLQVMDLTSSRQFEIGTAVEHVLAEKDNLSHALSLANRKIAEARLEAVPPTDGNYVLCLDAADTDTLRALALGGKDKISGLFVALTPDKNGYRYMIASNGPVAERAKAINQALQGRGGGRNPLIQGSFAAPLEQIKDYFQKFPYDI